jgi:alkanesulfonate monooxygenase SsuD/methylene tetrahydromethanopterin reductase-like flavin-dependent oxidoreductase (luciferase family)
MSARNAAMFGANRLKLGIFAQNCSSGMAATRVPERWDASWDNNLALARMADDAGIEFLLPIARWRGYGGETDFEGETLETLSWACGLLAHTRRINAFGTVHAPMVHPVFAAKQMVTIDHIAGGRFGLNLVCGWNADEFAMFGIEQLEHDTRYAYGEEWLTAVRRLWTADEPFDFEGSFIRLSHAISKPHPYGGRAPLVMNAGSSTVGRSFGARNCDMLFTRFVDVDAARQEIGEIRETARAAGRDVAVYTATYLVVRESRSAAEAYHRHYAVEMEDTAAVDHLTRMHGLHTRSLSSEEYDRYRLRYAAGHGCYPVVGTPEDAADVFAAIAAAGFDGTTISFVNYLDEFPYFAAEVLPRLVARGLRAA